jgi:hypothetical protein
MAGREENPTTTSGRFSNSDSSSDLSYLFLDEVTLSLT